MRQAKRWRYYCDFCKKSGGRKDIIVKHERGCTARPDRICGLCDHRGEVQPELTALTGFIDTYCKDLPRYDIYLDSVRMRDRDMISVSSDKLDPMVEELGKLANECPACMLAALRQAKTETYSNFKFKERLDAWWAEENANREPEYYYG